MMCLPIPAVSPRREDEPLTPSSDSEEGGQQALAPAKPHGGRRRRRGWPAKRRARRRRAPQRRPPRLPPALPVAGPGSDGPHTSRLVFLNISKWWFMKAPNPQLPREQQWLPSLARVAAAAEKGRAILVQREDRPWDFSQGATLQANGSRALAYLSSLLGNAGRVGLVGGAAQPGGISESNRPLYEPLFQQVPNNPQDQPQGLLELFSWNNNVWQPLCMAHTHPSGSYMRVRLGR